MRLLKIGTLNIPRNRWEDALNTFENISVVCFDSEVEINNPRINYIKYNNSLFLNKFLKRCADHFSRSKNTTVLCRICMSAMRILNIGFVNKIKLQNYDFIHSSYNDFDESGFLTMLLRLDNYTRAQKETRLSYSYYEYYAFKHASRIILNDPLNLALFENKYGKKVFDKKELIFDLDEDVRSKKIIDNIEYESKYSDVDGKIHAVILAGRVLSDPNDSRSGGRLYYLDLISRLLKSDIIVHLYTGNIVTLNGKNPYLDMAEKEQNFHIEGSLDFVDNTLNAYKMLSRYDIGVCHAHVKDTEVTEFDRVNIPHRYYEYHLAHVVPFDFYGGNLLLEKKAKENKALIINECSDITLDKLKKIEWDTPSFDNYIDKLYTLNSRDI